MHEAGLRVVRCIIEARDKIATLTPGLFSGNVVSDTGHAAYFNELFHWLDYKRAFMLFINLVRGGSSSERISCLKMLGTIDQNLGGRGSPLIRTTPFMSYCVRKLSTSTDSRVMVAAVGAER